MEDISIPDVDEEVLERLERRASRQDRTLEEEIKRIIERAARMDDDGFWSSMNSLRGRLKESGDESEESEETVAK